MEAPSPKPKTPIKQLPTKLGKNIKRSLRRISDHFHHHHHHHDHDHVTPSLASLPAITTTIISPVFPPHKHSRSSLSSSDRMSEHSSFSSPGTDSLSSHSPDVTLPIPDDDQASSTSSTPDDDPTTSPPSGLQLQEKQLSTHPDFESTRPIDTDVPDPFLVDDQESISSSGDSPAPPASSELNISPAPEPTLSTPPSPSQPVSLPSPNVNKDVPPPPAETDSDESDAPDLYLSGLILPSMFLPIPNTDPLSTLLTKYIYPPEERPARDLTGDWQRTDFHTLVMTNSWRALAKMARDRLVTTDPEDLTLILGLWYTRLACLARLRLFNQTSAECTNLFTVLNGIDPPEARSWVFERLLPFELEVMQARVKYWAGDHMGYLDALNVLLTKCRTKTRITRPDPIATSMWKERAARLCLMIASHLVEMKEFRTATKLLEPLCRQGETSTAALRSSIGRIYLQSGEVKKAAQHFAIVAQDVAVSQEMKDMNASLLASAEGDWARAGGLLQSVVEKDAENLVAVNNLSVALLSQGKLKEGISVLETALNASPSAVVVAEPFLFNLSTLYELRSSMAAESKRNLLIEVAKWSGDGLRVACLKMPSN